MFALQKIARQAPRLQKLTECQRRTLLVTPPRVRLSFPEKVMHGIAFYVGVTTIPFWVVFNVKNYKKRE